MMLIILTTTVAQVSSSVPHNVPTSSSNAPPEVPHPALAPQSNLSLVANPNLIPPGPPDVTTRNHDDIEDTEDAITFTGMWCSSVDASFSANASVSQFTPNDGVPESVPDTPDQRIWVVFVDSTAAVADPIFQPIPSSSSCAIERENALVVGEHFDSNNDTEDDDFYFDIVQDADDATLPIDKGDNFVDSVEGYGFDPFCIQEICHKPSFIDCACDTIEVELQRDQVRMINGPTTVKRGLSDETFTLLASDPHALVSIGGG